uniref:WH2 domain-containing protein n=1 Tax=Heterorhabditis bacteriophora TaxID=37862 RepID=A0A1I7XDQ4_HETBA
MLRSEASSESTTPIPLVPPPVPRRNSAALSSSSISRPPFSCPLTLPSTSMVSAGPPPTVPPPELPKRPPPIPPRPQLSAQESLNDSNKTRKESTDSTMEVKVPPNTLLVGKVEPLKVPITSTEPTRHYIYQDLICELVFYNITFQGRKLLFIFFSDFKHVYSYMCRIIIIKVDKVHMHKFYTKKADQICYAVLCVFSFAAAGHKKPE